MNEYAIAAAAAAAAAANMHAKTNDDGGDCVGTPIYTGQSDNKSNVFSIIIVISVIWVLMCRIGFWFCYFPTSYMPSGHRSSPHAPVQLVWCSTVFELMQKRIIMLSTPQMPIVRID